MRRWKSQSSTSSQRQPVSQNDAIAPTARTRVKRLPKRASYDRDAIYSILDTALVCHVGFAIDGQPYVIPTLHVRIDDRLYIHGSAASRMLGAAADGTPLAVTVTHIDGVVLARSAFHHSVNYRSAVILGIAKLVADPAEKLVVMKGLIDHVAPGRWDHIRHPNEKELAATSVLSIPIDGGVGEAQERRPDRRRSRLRAAHLGGTDSVCNDGRWRRSPMRGSTRRRRSPRTLASTGCPRIEEQEPHDSDGGDGDG